jgi:FKBP-type peptidyl-prolyl cis-trans isomerase
MAEQEEIFDDSKAKFTTTGLRYIETEVGTGAQPTRESTVLVHYRGRLTDGSQFDSSFDRGQPTAFPVTGVIPGFSEGILGMKEGGKRTLYIPWALGYGIDGNPPVIPPRADLVFDVELIEVQ